jgi:L-iditol 2-dehydrogenase
VDEGSRTVQALQFVESKPRYAATKAAGMLSNNAFWSRAACLQLNDVRPPALPGPDWLRINTRYGGICGTDIGTILLQSSLALEPYTSMPFTLGHENTGRISRNNDEGHGFEPGQRVVINPLLACEQRGFADNPCEMCATGRPNLCFRFRCGDVSAGMLIGFCRDTGGSWGPEFIAHKSQVIPLPADISDEAAVITEPFAIALNAVLRNPPEDNETVLVMGSGVMGLVTLAAIRATGSRSRVLMTARHSFQIEIAQRLGADEVIKPERGVDFFHQIAERIDAQVLKPVLGKHVVNGGVDRVYECVGSDSTLDDALRLIRGSGMLVLVGIPKLPSNVDWTPIWFHEIDVHGAFGYAIHEFEGKALNTMQLAVDLIADGRADLAPLVTHRFRLDDYANALTTATSRGRNNVIRSVFEFDPE